MIYVWALLGLAVAIVAGILVGFLLSFVWSWATMQPRGDFWRRSQPKTVEQEQDSSRAVVAATGHWNGITTHRDMRFTHNDWDSDECDQQGIGA